MGIMSYQSLYRGFKLVTTGKVTKQVLLTVTDDTDLRYQCTGSLNVLTVLIIILFRLGVELY